MKAKKSLYTIAMLALVLAVGVACSKPMKTDAQVSGDVQNQIGSDSALQGRSVAVQSTNGTVTLTGTVNSDAEKVAASNAASRVEGVKQVLNNLTVAPAQQAAATAPAQEQQPAAEPAPAPTKRPSAAHREPTRSHSSSSGSGSNSNYSADNSAAMSAPPAMAQATPAAAAAAPAPAVPAPPKKVSVPDGTAMSIRLNDPLDSERNQTGDVFRATLNVPITLDDNVVIPEGADIEGRVSDVKSAAHFAGASLLALELTKVSYNGHSYPIHTNMWQKQGTARGKNTAAKVGGGAAIGAVIGAIAGGGKGAAIGSVVGAGAGTGAQAVTKGEQIKLNSEQLLSFTLASPVTVMPASTYKRGGQRLSVPDNSTDQPQQ